MANEVYEGQELTVIYTDEDGVDFGPLNIRVDYWAPGNSTSTPTGTIIPGNVTKGPESDEVTIKFAEDILSPASKPTGENWRYQIFDTDTEIGWTPGCIEVLKRGAQVC